VCKLYIENARYFHDEEHDQQYAIFPGDIEYKTTLDNIDPEFIAEFIEEEEIKCMEEEHQTYRKKKRT